MDIEEDVDDASVSVGELDVKDWWDGEVVNGLVQGLVDMEGSSSVKRAVDSVVRVVVEKSYWSDGV